MQKKNKNTNLIGNCPLFWQMKLIFITLLLGMLWGCHLGDTPIPQETFTTCDMYHYQPLCKPTFEVVGILEEKHSRPLMQLYTLGYKKVDLLWKVDNIKRYSSNDIIIESDTFLKDDSSSRPSFDMVKIPEDKLPNNKSYPWLRYRNAIDQREVIVDTQTYEKDGLTYTTSQTETENYLRSDGYFYIKTICCLNPLVVIISEGTILHFPTSQLININQNDENLPFLREAIIEKRTNHIYPSNIEMANGIILKNGYAYGTRIPYAESPQWFSPDMNIPPTPVKIDDEEIGHISVPWGELLMTREGDGWVVSAKAK
ncbi:hypothetical protein SMSP2_00305 [Limihaloglobus sulfuriphilus]|uniref:Uncharacterized protein n=2 Tax=Limihaloglobus sulfuriphilus TaxID=1851148 RepID=A0A1Q2MBD3_9BACT|nr:hypothetical protein SMSP2_00305 [Limihaloglobus sulfuriphilus]